MPKVKAVVFLILLLILSSGENAFAQKKSSGSGKQSVGAKTIKTNAVGQTGGKIKAPAFELKDQFNKKFAVKFPAKKVTVLVFGDRDGAEQIESWVRPLYKKYTNKIEIYGIAELSVVPWVAKSFVRNFIKNRSKQSVMLDWSGKVSKDYGYEKQKANLFIISEKGYITAEKTGAATAAELENLYKEIDGLL